MKHMCTIYVVCNVLCLTPSHTNQAILLNFLPFNLFLVLYLVALNSLAMDKNGKKVQTFAYACCKFHP